MNVDQRNGLICSEALTKTQTNHMKLKRLDKELTQILVRMIESEKMIDQEFAHLHSDYKLSAKNLFVI